MTKPDQTRIRSPRDVRLDFFRGLAMFVIFIAHMPGNAWFDYIPARFGFSSAAELFVFCSGLASSFAFGKGFLRDGFLEGTRRILFRMWQVYWAHIGLAMVLMAISVAAFHLTGLDYPTRIGLTWFFGNTGDGLLKLMTLMFTPTFLDILPMYLVLLAMVPLVMALASVHPWLVFAALGGLWASVQLFGITLPGGQEPGMTWFFNPFAWQLVFFTGYSFGMGWLKAPTLKRGVLFYLCLFVLILAVPLNFWALTDAFVVLEQIHDMLVGPMGKTNFNLLLYLHFLASAYVALVLVEPVRHRLAAFWPIMRVGQQALAAFMTSIVLAWTGGMVLDALGRDILVTSLVNLAGIALLVAAATISHYYKGGGSPGSPVGKLSEKPEAGDVSHRMATQPAQ